ncbi:2-keto-3-deoxy-L-fuconate dehydrogenase [Mameliella alba]|uniref:SDR family oxidoreductase n=1 Tax=Mameliella TaxID=1434019 RepID=UPI0008410B00|nr:MULTISPECIES: SDR family oxidoreductase [Mameliella]ODM48463.1 NAD(P)-dependent oxidoreductase [Ruegeria sp. PBVC088]MDD9730632.1 SDR family oxidoreductase [Mameliella sp. AT18]OWV46819.1 NAD(P)-dependent oxidoreductase [Mameliella alba]PTR37739.1 2-keto-3-deoxy-L-fuconate dehydrogenase [Mameliella alba]SDD62055.1 2-keto-3-deoxy-L-fuconate dehydrogenase [Mameliella alba]
MKRLKGKTCVVTAAGQGIGRATAERLAAEGGRVIATDINEAALAELNAIDGIEARRLDVLDAGAITAFAAEVGTADVLFNCAGIVHNGTILESTEDEWDFAFDLNAKAQYRMIRAFLPAMLEQKSGSIINMSSVAGPVTGPVNRFVYSASKAAVAGMTLAIANDYVTQGIRCNAIAPGTVDSPSLHDRLRATGDYDAALKTFIGRQPMGRIGKPEEIAALVAYLAADESGFTTGQVHVIDGGWTA